MCSRSLYSRVVLIALLLAPFFATPVGAFDSGSDGSDGALDASRIQSLPLDPNDPPGGPEVRLFVPSSLGADLDGDGVFHFTSIAVPSNTTLRLSAEFLGEGKPMVWLVAGDVTIPADAAIDLDGESGHAYNAAVLRSWAGAGGFNGGRGGNAFEAPLSGNGPGGGRAAQAPDAFLPDGIHGASAGHLFPGQGPDEGAAGVSYGSRLLLPLVGGSGGGGGTRRNTFDGPGGGAGGGAILIAVSGNVQLDGSVSARGGRAGAGGGNCTNFGRGGGGGSGGAIRIVSSSLQGTGVLAVDGGGRSAWNCAGQSLGFAGSPGRVRMEADLNLFSGSVSPVGSSLTTSRPGPLFLPPSAGRIDVVSIGATPIPLDPSDPVAIDASPNVAVSLQAVGVPAGTEIRVTLNPENGDAVTLTTTLDATLSATVDASFPFGVSRIVVTATW